MLHIRSLHSGVQLAASRVLYSISRFRTLDTAALLLLSLKLMYS